ncbi:MAG TPA: glycosyltransferase [Geobacteraceae bacterium]|nr:glycosyltransferase [Geobacteraceae bacterium]
MDNPLIDIIVSVWNRPTETRNCLVNLINHSPAARFILVDNGSDRETERLLEEFAEILDQRAVLLRNNVNQGYVRAVNKGLAHAMAPYVAIVSNTSTVTDCWLESLIRFGRERNEAGIIVPRLFNGPAGKPVKGRGAVAKPIETDHGSLAVMLLKKQLYDIIGGLDEEMDGGLWCLKDFSRRAYRAGFFTFRVAEGMACYLEEIRFGSAQRREIAVQRSITRYRERWGDDGSFLLHMPKDVDPGILRQKLEIIRQGARQGHLFTTLTHARLYRELKRAGFDCLHENIRFVQLPLMFETRAISRALACMKATMPDARAVTGIDGIPFPAGMESIPFAELEQLIVTGQAELFGG